MTNRFSKPFRNIFYIVDNPYGNHKNISPTTLISKFTYFCVPIICKILLHHDLEAGEWEYRIPQVEDIISNFWKENMDGSFNILREYL